MRICFLLAALAAVAGAEVRVTSVVRPNRSGRLVRSNVVIARAVVAPVIASRLVSPVVPRPEPPPQTGALNELVDQIARRHDLPPQLVHSVIRVESNYNPFAISSKGALGLMQLIPATARRFGVANVFNPAQNVEGGAKYLRYLLDLYGGNYGLALAAYNAGEGAVARYGGIPPYPETRDYVGSVWKKLNESKSAPEPPPAKPEKKPAGAPNSIREVVEADGSVHYVTR